MSEPPRGLPPAILNSRLERFLELVALIENGGDGKPAINPFVYAVARRALAYFDQGMTEEDLREELVKATAIRKQWWSHVNQQRLHKQIAGNAATMAILDDLDLGDLDL